MPTIQDTLKELETALLEKLPNMPTLLRDIHTQLRRDPDLCTALTERDCTILVEGLTTQTKTEIVTTQRRKRSKPMKEITLDDL